MSGIFEATNIGDSKYVRDAIDSGLDVNTKCNQFGDTLLHLAIKQGTLNTAIYLLENGADVNAVNNSVVSVFMAKLLSSVRQK